MGLQVRRVYLLSLVLVGCAAEVAPEEPSAETLDTESIVSRRAVREVEPMPDAGENSPSEIATVSPAELFRPVIEEEPWVVPYLPDVCAGEYSPEVISIREFGAVGDGVTDDYVALKAAADAMSDGRGDGRVLLFPQGTYRIDRLARHALDHIVYRNAKDFMIIGCDAKIDIEGNMSVSPNVEGGIIPFIFNRCARFSVEGLELDGNSDEAPFAGGGPAKWFHGSGIVTSGSHDYMLSNLEIHHFPTDGMMIGQAMMAHGTSIWSFQEDHDFLIENVISRNVARATLGIFNAYDGIIRDSQFLEAGRSGSFGPIDCMCGIDIEPDYNDRSNVGLTVPTGNILFDSITIRGALSHQFAAQLHRWVENVTILDSTIEAYDDSFHSVVAMTIPGGRIERTTIDTRFGTVHLGNGNPNATTLLNDVTILTEGLGLHADNPQGSVRIENSRFQGRHTRAGAPYLPLLRGERVTLQGNTFFLPTALYAQNGSPLQPMIYLNVALSEGNIFLSDLDPAGGRAFGVEYGVLGINNPSRTTRVINDQYPLSRNVLPRFAPNFQGGPFSQP